MNRGFWTNEEYLPEWLGEHQRTVYYVMPFIILSIPVLPVFVPSLQLSVPALDTVVAIPYAIAALIHAITFRHRVAGAWLFSFISHVWTLAGIAINGLVPAMVALVAFLFPLLLLAPMVALRLNGVAIAIGMVIILLRVPGDEPFPGFIADTSFAIRLVVLYAVAYGACYLITRAVFLNRHVLLHSQQAQRESLQRQQGIEQLDRELHAILEHELSIPVRTLAAVSDELHSELGAQESKEIRQLARHTNRMLDELIHRSLDHQAEQSVAAPTPTEDPLCVSLLLDRVLLGVKELAEEKEVHIRLVGHYDAEQWHTGSEQVIRQVTQNLIKNAILHSGAHTVTLTLTCREVSDVADRFTVTVADSGRGIPAELRELVFDRGQRGPSGENGQGLGLYVARQKALTMPEGDLRYVQHPVGGARFEFAFTLPRYAIEPSANEEVSVDTMSRLLNRQRVLVVDDSALQRSITCDVLRRAGAEVIEAGNGKDAMSAVRASDFKFIFTDIHMPIKDGHELLANLKTRNYEGFVVGLHNNPTALEARLLIDEGAVGVLAKPLDHHHLRKLLQQLRRDQRFEAA